MAYKNHEDSLKYQKEYYAKNIERKTAYRKAKYEANKEEVCRKARERRIRLGLLHPRIVKTHEEVLAKQREWREKNREKYNQNARNWHRRNKEKVSIYHKAYYRERLPIASQFGRARASAKDRGYEFTLTLDEFIQIIITPCIYCGETEKRRGIDRVENKNGYTKENSLSCCKICNYMKKTLTKPEFLAHIEKIYKYNQCQH